MLRKLGQLYRSKRLSAKNRLRLRNVLPESSAGIPVFFIFTPELVHFAPFCLTGIAPGFAPVIVLNSVTEDDESWLRERLPNQPIVRLVTSLSNNPNSMLAHAEVLNDLFAVCNGTFCIQDPDCFVTDESFWKHVPIESKHFAGGPFVKRPSHHEHVLPDTFFLTFDSRRFNDITSRYGITANVVRDVNSRAQARLKTVGYSPGQYPESYKDYFDTLQAYWLLSLADGLEFKLMPGAGEYVFHIGGTSYMHKTDYDLAHWDYWPLSVHYFNLRLLEQPALQRFRERFQLVIDQHQSADDLLQNFPEFTQTKRYQQTQRILSTFRTLQTSTNS
jgi:hypothetical protein